MLLNYSDTGGRGTPVVLIHGMAASTRYWNKFRPHIDKERRIIAIDLLGFGHSPMPTDVTYNYETHIESIMDTLENLGVTAPFTLLGHSMGGLIALRLAAKHPQLIRNLVLIAMPVYDDAQQAHRAITASSRLKEWAYYGFSSKLLCNAWCRILRPLSRLAAPKYLPQLTKEAAQDSVLHTWQSYAQSLHYVIENQNTAADIASIEKPVVLVYGDKDIPDGLENLRANLNDDNHKLVILKGSHQIINENPQKIAELM